MRDQHVMLADEVHRVDPQCPCNPEWVVDDYAGNGYWSHHSPSDEDDTAADCD